MSTVEELYDRLMAGADDAEIEVPPGIGAYLSVKSRRWVRSIWVPHRVYVRITYQTDKPNLWHYTIDFTRPPAWVQHRLDLMIDKGRKAVGRYMLDLMASDFQTDKPDNRLPF